MTESLRVETGMRVRLVGGNTLGTVRFIDKSSSKFIYLIEWDSGSQPSFYSREDFVRVR